jgi:hypothetical protein
LPSVDNYTPEYYGLDTLSCGWDVSASALMDERQISYVASKSLSSSSYREVKNEEALAKDTMSVLRWPYTESPRAYSIAKLNFLK